MTDDRRCKESFELWAETLDLCLDEIFMSSDGVPENPYESNDTSQFYRAWVASWEACQVEMAVDKSWDTFQKAVKP